MAAHSGGMCAAAAAPRRGAPLPGGVSGQTGKAAQGGRRRGLRGGVRSYLEGVSNRETIVAKIRERADVVDYSGTTWYTSCMGDF